MGSRPFVALLLLSLTTVLGCSSPTSPTSPTQPPPSNGQPPALTITCPASPTVTAQNASGIQVTFAMPVTAGGTAPVQTSCTPASASLFPVGTTTVRCTVTDAGQRTNSCSFNVTVMAPVPQLTRTRFLAFGDSLTVGEVTQPTGMRASDGSPYLRLVVVPAASYPTQLLTQLRGRYTGQTTQLQVANSGNAAEWAEDGAKRLPGVLANARPEAVLLLEGINDISALGTPGVQRAWLAIDTMAKEVRNRGGRLFLATLPPTRSGSKSVPLTLVQSLNSLIRTTARGENAVLVDLYEALSSDVNRYIGVDGVHPTEAGYQRMADTFFAAIRTDLEAR
jgi:lysophospholipase L1-like esterase